MDERFVENWDVFLAPYQQAVAELKLKFKQLRRDFQLKNQHAPIEFVTGRVKSKESILEKMDVRHVDPEDFLIGIQDIAGIRIMCQFVEDIYHLAELIMDREDMEVVLVRDYIKNYKQSGYRSYHMVIDYPVQQAQGVTHIIAEIQIRTLAMNFWATIEHSLNYKYQGDYPEYISSRLQRASEAAYQLDKEMSEIRQEIKEATDYYENRHDE